MAGFRRAKVSLVFLALVTLGTLLVAACGAQGETGSQGIQGPQGIQGARGIQGAQGPVGLPPQAADVQRIVQPMVIGVVPQLEGPPGVEGPQGHEGSQGVQGPSFVEEAGLALDKRAYVQGLDGSISVYGSGFVRDEYVLPQILGANPRGFTAEGVKADANGAFATTISLRTELTMLSSGSTRDDRVQPGTYTLQVTGGEGTFMTIPVVVVEKSK